MEGDGEGVLRTFSFKMMPLRGYRDFVTRCSEIKVKATHFFNIPIEEVEMVSARGGRLSPRVKNAGTCTKTNASEIMQFNPAPVE